MESKHYKINHPWFKINFEKYIESRFGKVFNTKEFSFFTNNS